MNDLVLLLIILASVIVGMFGGHFISVLSFKYTHEKKERDVDTSDPKLKDEEVDCQIMVNVYKSGKVNMTPYTKNQEPLPNCVREEALHKAMLQLGYTKPLQAVCTKSTTLEPVLVEVEPEPADEGLDAVYPKTVNEVVDKMQGKRNAKASESKAD